MRRQAVLAVAALLAGAVGAAAGRPVTLLTVIGERGETVLAAALREDDRVGLGFVHSSEGVRVASWFRPAGGRLQAVQTEMEGFGPGLDGAGARLAASVPGGRGADGGEPRLVVQDGPEMTALDLRVGPTTGHWVAVGEKRADLSARVPEGRASYRFSLQVRRLPVGMAWVLGVFRAAPR